MSPRERAAAAMIQAGASMTEAFRRTGVYPTNLRRALKALGIPTPAQQKKEALRGRSQQARD